MSLYVGLHYQNQAFCCTVDKLSVKGSLGSSFNLVTILYHLFFCTVYGRSKPYNVMCHVVTSLIDTFLNCNLGHYLVVLEEKPQPFALCALADDLMLRLHILYDHI